MKNLVTDDGHVFTIEDIQTYAMWKIKELRAKEWNDEIILSFDESEMWRRAARVCLAMLDMENNKRKQHITINNTTQNETHT